MSSLEQTCKPALGPGARSFLQRAFGYSSQLRKGRRNGFERRFLLHATGYNPQRCSWKATRSQIWHCQRLGRADSRHRERQTKVSGGWVLVMTPDVFVPGGFGGCSPSSLKRNAVSKKHNLLRVGDEVGKQTGGILGTWKTYGQVETAGTPLYGSFIWSNPHLSLTCQVEESIGALDIWRHPIPVVAFNLGKF